MKILLGILCMGLLMAAGGVGILVASGYDALSFEIWSLGAQSLIETPADVFEEILNGSQKELFGGVVAGILGAVIGMLSLLLMNVILIFSGIAKSIKGRKARSGWSEKEVEKIHPDRGQDNPEKVGLAEEKKARGPGLAQRLKNWRTARSQKVFEDAPANLEDEEKEPGKIQVILAGLASKLKGFRSSPKQVVIQSGDNEKVVIEVEDEEEFERDLRQWFAGIRGAEANDADMIVIARDLKSRATKRLKSFIVEKDSMNGEFMLRMLDAWAAKTVDDETRQAPATPPKSIIHTTEQSVFVEAIEEVERTGVRTQDDGEDFIPDDGMEDPEIIDDMDYSDDMIPDDEGDEGRPAEEDYDQDPDPDDKGVSGGAGGTFLSVERARAIISFQRQATAVQDGAEEWDEDLADEDLRREVVEEMISSLEANIAAEWDEIQVLSQLDMGDDEEVFEWIKENASNLAELREDLSRLAGIDDTGIEDDGGEDGDEGDLDAAFSIRGTSGAEQENQSSDEASENDTDIPGESVLEAVEVEVEQEMEPTVSGEPDTEAAVPGQEVGTQPRDLSLDQLEEIEKSGELIYRWGHAMRSAGAAEARLCHSVLAKDGVRRRVVGIVHLVAKWRDEEKDEGIRINIVLRYLPEGEWFLDEEAGTPRMTNLQGDFVEVSGELIRQPEVEGSMLIVHFYGPGAAGDLKEEGDLQMIVTEALSAEEIKGIVGKQRKRTS